jgi:diguanylate cyclase (GGDEF)-like protein/PAS domain S-box-containing protein
MRKHSRLKGRRLAAAILACALSPCALAAGPPLRVAGDRDYPPITYLDNGVAKGFDVDVVRALGAVLGRDMQVELMPWDAAQKRVQESGGLLTGMSVTEERRALWDFATPTVTHSFGLFVRAREFAIHGVDDLRGKRVGVTAGGLPRTYLKDRPGLELVVVPDYRGGLDMLQAGRIDALAADTWVAGYIINRDRIQGVALAGEPFAALEGAIAVPRGNPALLAEINRGLDILASRGTIDAIRRNWEPKQVVFLLKEEVASYIEYAGAAVILLVLAALAAWIVRLRRDNRARRRIEAELRRFRICMDSTADLITIVDPRRMRYLDVNEATCRALGYGREELLGMNPSEVFSIVGVELDRSYTGVMAGDAQPSDVEGIYRRRDGTTFPVESFRRAVPAPEGDIIVAVARDITRRTQADARIRRLSRVYAVLSGINGAIVRIAQRDALFAEACRVAVEAGQFRMAWIGLIDGGRVKPVAWAGDVRGYFDTVLPEVMEIRPDGRGLAGRAAARMQPVVSNDVRTDPQILMKDELESRGIGSLAVLPLVVGARAVGALSLYAADAGFFDEEEIRLLLELAGDIAFALDHIEKEEKVRYLAYYDSLTGIANRTLFLERLAQHVATARGEGQQLALILINIQRFKTINDAFGRQTGDALLKQMAARLLEVNNQDQGRVARVGADHFAVVVPHVKSLETLVRNGEAAQRRLDGDPYAIGGSEIRISTQAGAALFPADGEDAESLFRNAEAALKKAGSGERYVFYTRQMSERVAEKVSLENKLRLALERDEFVLHYQPKVDARTRRVVGLEALIRWQSTELGLVPPMHFIPLMEETGLILPVGSWALAKASLDQRRLAELGLEAPRIAVNVSPIQLRQRDFVSTLKQAVAGDGAPTGIDLEITESLIMEDIDANIAKLTEARALGMEIAIDDFGTGYSSLAYLARLPVQALKIDRSFIVGMLQKPDMMTVVSTIVSLAHSIKLKVVAEGVDAEEQAVRLRELGCDQMQGYLFSKPVPFDAVAVMLRKGK